MLTVILSHKQSIARWGLLLLLLALSLSARAVDILVPSTGSDTVNLTPGVTYTVYDPGGTSNYPNNCSGHLILLAPAGYMLSFQGELNLYTSSSSGGGGGWGGNSSGGDSLTFYSTAVANNANRLISYTTSCSCVLTVNTNTAHLVFSSNNSGQASGFALTLKLVQVPNEESCISYLDLQNDGQGYYGTFTNPSANLGCAPGRHEVIYWDELDPNTGNLLHRIPDGESYSVRLGNDLPGGQAERISYPFIVDTSQVQLLILKYAAVLEAPNHSADRNPKFTFRILDQTGNDVDANCYSATFIADASLGWNICNAASTTVYWKDWTTVGVDLSGLDQQNITIELTTYDCNPQNTGHYGYAYFTLGCADKVIHTSACGDFLGDTLTAPSGFNYSWYNTASPNQTLGTNQQLVVTTPGTYGCHLNFVGDNTHTCQFELTALVSSVYTFAQFTSDYDASQHGARQVCFQNLSGIASTNNPALIDATRAYSSLWDFGDGTTSTQQSPCHQFAIGEYDVTLVVCEVGRDCYDTATFHISISDQVVVQLNDTICQGGGYFFFDSVLTLPGQYTHSSDTQLTQLTLVVLPTYEVNDQRQIVENDLPYHWGAITITGDLDTSVVLASQHGCDSLVHLSIRVFYNTHSTVDTTLCSSLLPWTWNGATFTAAGQREVVLQGAHGEDSVITITVHVIESYSEDLYFRSCDKVPVHYDGNTYTQTGVYPITYTAQNGCDSIIRIHVAIEAVPPIEIGANPPSASPDNPTIHLSSLGGGATQWQWWVDGMPLSSECTAEYTFSPDVDSVTICLMAASASGCADTDCIVVPFYKGVAWVPTAFTPEMPTNNTFYIGWNQLLEAHLWIYTRSGLLITDFDALTGSWDGTKQGDPCPQDSYVWLLRYTTLNQPKITQETKGLVLLIR